MRTLFLAFCLLTFTARAQLRLTPLTKDLLATNVNTTGLREAIGVPAKTSAVFVGPITGDALGMTNYVQGITPFRQWTRLVFFGSSLTGGDVWDTYANHLTNYYLPRTNLASATILASAGATIASLDAAYWPTVTALAPSGGTNGLLLYWGTLNDIYQGHTDVFDQMSNDWTRAKLLGYQVVTLTLLDVPYTHIPGSGFTPLTAEMLRRSVNQKIRAATNYYRLVDADMLMTDYTTTTFDNAHTTQDAANLIAKEVGRVLSMSTWSAPHAQGGVLGATAQAGLDLIGPLRLSAGFATPSVLLAGTYTATTNDVTMRCDTTSAGFTVNLPPTPTTGQIVNVKKISSDGNTLTISGNGHNIDGSATKTTTTQYTNFRLQYNGSTWDAL